jgi:hypothetical protein
MKRIIAGVVLCAGITSAQYGQFPPPSDAFDAVMEMEYPYGNCGTIQMWAFYTPHGIEGYWFYVPNGNCPPAC